jgi:hypothetical protein
MVATEAMTQSQTRKSRALCNKMSQDVIKMGTEKRHFAIEEDELRAMSTQDLNRLRSYVTQEMRLLENGFPKGKRLPVPGPGAYNGEKPRRGNMVPCFRPNIDKFTDDCKSQPTPGAVPLPTQRSTRSARMLERPSEISVLHDAERARLGPGAYDVAPPQPSLLPSLTGRNFHRERRDSVPGPGQYGTGGTAFDDAPKPSLLMVPMGKTAVQHFAPSPIEYDAGGGKALLSERARPRRPARARVSKKK